MAVFAPPAEIAGVVDRFAPGIYAAFIGRLVWSGLPFDTGVTSWWRSTQRNRDVGGHAESQHLLGLALDLTSSRPEQIVESARRVGIIAVPDVAHVHVQAWPPGTADRIGLLRALGL